MSALTSARESRLRRAVARGAGIVWVGTAGLTLAVGVMAAIAMLGWAATCGLFLLVAASGWLWCGLRWLLEEDPGTLRLRAAGLVPAMGVVSAIGLLGLLGLAAVPLAAVLAVAHPAVRRWIRVAVGPERWARITPTRVRSDPVATTPGARALPMVEEPELVVTDELTDGDLCEAWRSSYVALQRARTDASRLRAVEMRALYLDDLERRLGDDFARWMRSLPRAAEDPRRFLRDQEPRG
ncbi:hypothetical protein [Nocardioides sp. P5_C9_2]